MTVERRGAPPVAPQAIGDGQSRTGVHATGQPNTRDTVAYIDAVRHGSQA